MGKIFTNSKDKIVLLFIITYYYLPPDFRNILKLNLEKSDYRRCSVKAFVVNFHLLFALFLTQETRTF
jgi:hypothetical protein